jgi:hypothetical protein
VADLEGSFITAGVQAAAGVNAVVLDDTIADTVHAARPGVGGLALQVGNTRETERDSHSFAHASNSCPHNYEIISFLRGFTAAQTETNTSTNIRISYIRFPPL